MSHPSTVPCYRRILNTTNKSFIRRNQANQKKVAQQGFSSCILHPMPIETLLRHPRRYSPNLSPCTHYSALIGVQQLYLNLTSFYNLVNGESKFVGHATGVENA